MKALYVIHPTFWDKHTVKLYFKSLVSNKFWQKLHWIEQLNDLYQYVDPEEITLPEVVWKMKPIFGSPLEEVFARPDHSRNVVPSVVEVSVKYLIDSKGISFDTFLNLQRILCRVYSALLPLTQAKSPN